MPLLPAGAPVFIYQTITYSFANSVLVPGRTALWRTVAGGAAEEVAVPEPWLLQLSRPWPRFS